MIQEFVNYEQALALKELGFDEPYLGAYYHATKSFAICDYKIHKANGEHTVIAPLKQQALRWFRSRGFIIDISSHENCEYDYYIRCPPVSILSDLYDTYEEAENSCIDKLIELSRHFQEYD